MLKTRQLERIVKGYANHRRISMMQLLFDEPELSVQDIAVELKINIKTASEHLSKLAIAGLVLKRDRSNNVLHKLSPRGLDVLEFLRKLE